VRGSEEKAGAGFINFEELTESDLPRTVLSLAWPVVVEQTFFALGSVINTILIGRLGASALAAIGLGQQAEFMPQVIFAAVVVGATAIVARHVGAGEAQEANHTVGQSIILAVIFGVVFTVPLWLFAEQAMALLRARPDVVELGARYIRSVTPSLIPGLILAAGGSVLRGAGDTRTPMLVMIVVSVFNLILGYLLIYGGLGIPALGVPGAGIAASISRTIGALAIVAVLVRGSGMLKYRLSGALRFDLGEMRRIFGIGLPAGAEQVQMQIAFTIYAVIISSLGTVTYAAHAVAMRVEGFAFMPGWGFGIAAMALVGQSLGAERPELGEKAAYLAQRYAMIMMTVVGALMFFFGRQLSSVFISDPEVIRVSALGVKIWAFAMPMMGTSNTLAGALRGAGDTRWVFLFMTLSIWLVRLPIAFLLAQVAHLGAAGAWTGAVLDINARGALTWWRFATGKWKTIKI
jgi:putative MATE family efflux protein